MEKKDEILFLEVFNELGGLLWNGLIVQRADTDNILKINLL